MYYMSRKEESRILCSPQVLAMKNIRDLAHTCIFELPCLLTNNSERNQLQRYDIILMINCIFFSTHIDIIYKINRFMRSFDI